MVQAWSVKRAKDPEVFLAQLEAPLKGQDPKKPTESQAKQEEEDFLAFYAQFGGQV